MSAHYAALAGSGALCDVGWDRREARSKGVALDGLWVLVGEGAGWGGDGTSLGWAGLRPPCPGDTYVTALPQVVPGRRDAGVGVLQHGWPRGRGRGH